MATRQRWAILCCPRSKKSQVVPPAPSHSGRRKTPILSAANTNIQNRLGIPCGCPFSFTHQVSKIKRVPTRSTPTKSIYKIYAAWLTYWDEKGERFGAKGRRDGVAEGGTGGDSGANASTSPSAAATPTGAPTGAPVIGDIVPVVRNRLCSKRPSGAQINIPVEKPHKIKLRMPMTCA